MKFKVVVVQFHIAQFAPEKNIDRAEQFIKKAALQHADIVVFPEDFITGPLYGKEAEVYVDFDGKYRTIFQGFARKYKIDIVMGSVIEGDHTGWYNTCHYISSAGKIKGSYRKVNLWLPERKLITPGNAICVFNTRFGKVGLTICWDLIFPEIFRRMAHKGVNIVFCPSYWYQTSKRASHYDKHAEKKCVDALCTARAFENEIALIYVNAATDTAEARLNGQSQIAVPFKGALQKIEHTEEDFFVQEIDTALLREIEKENKIRKDMKTRIL